MSTRRSPWLILALLGALSCDGGGDDGGDGDTGGGDGADDGGGDDGGDGGTDGGGGDGGGDDGGDGGSGDDGDAGPPCKTSADCGDGQFCNYRDESCGVSEIDGSCQVVPSDCAGEERPVCGCDDVVYDTTCQAAAAGQDVKFLGECTPPSGAFPCGFSFCIGGQEYCMEQGGAMPSFECIELPPVCDPGDCYCMQMCCGCATASCCADYCTNDGGNTTYTCPG